ncbi:MAG: hypothetical protein H5U29_07925 [Pusillimonas sp.]|nr:hypothetical protein [Pusillimonas sp.]
MSRLNNIENLKQWVGAIPAYAEPLGLSRTRWDLCFLMSSRSAGEIDAMLDVLQDQLIIEGEINSKFQFTSPELNWELHGTPLWRCICSIPIEQRKLANHPENWEFVGAMALFYLRSAIKALRREPIGIDPARRVVGPKPQQLIAEARSLLFLAYKEKEAKFILTGRKSRAAAEKGNRVRHNGEHKKARTRIILAEAEKLKKKNPRLGLSTQAKRISEVHRGLTGFGWRTVYEVLKTDQNK